MKLLLSISIFSFCQFAFAQEQLNLRCVGNMTEQLQALPSLTEVRTTTAYIERFYELSQDEVIEHIGALTFQGKRAKIEKKEDDGSHQHDGYYRFEPLLIVFDENSAFKFVDGNNDVAMRHFMIDRQTTKWAANETYRDSMLDNASGMKVLKSVSILGNCEHWNAKPKF